MDSALDFALKFKIYGTPIKPLQIRGEFRRLMEIVQTARPKIVVELGTAMGGTLFCFARAAHPTATLISLDLPSSQGGYLEWKKPLLEAFALPGQRIHLLKEDSHRPETFAKVKNILGPRAIDFLFIDADHSYKGVKKDYELYLPLMSPEGLIAFHDIVPSYLTRYDVETSVGIVEVARFWEELKASLPEETYEEIIQDPDQDARGIGVLKLPVPR